MSTKDRINPYKPEDRWKLVGSTIPEWTASGLLEEYRAGKREAHPMEVDYDKADFLRRQRADHDAYTDRELEREQRRQRGNVFVRFWRWLIA